MKLINRKINTPFFVQHMYNITHPMPCEYTCKFNVSLVRYVAQSSSPDSCSVGIDRDLGIFGAKTGSIKVFVVVAVNEV